MKIIIILRDPVDRAYSHFLNDLNSGIYHWSFEEVINRWKQHQLSEFDNYIDYGFYYEQVQAYISQFKDVKVCLFENLENDPDTLMKDLFHFLGVNDLPVSDFKIQYNLSAGSKNPWLTKLIIQKNPVKDFSKLIFPYSIRTRIRNLLAKIFLNRPQLDHAHKVFLKQIYHSDILKLQDLIKKDLSVWLC